MTVTACAAVVLSAALPATPVLAAGTTTQVLVFGGTAWQVMSAKTFLTCGAPPCVSGATVTLSESISGLLFQDFRAVELGHITAAERDAYIWISNDGQGTVTFLSSAIVSEYEISALNSNDFIATVKLASTQSNLTTVCTGPDDSCVPPVGIPTLQLGSSANPATVGDTVTYTARESTLMGAPPPGGVVTFTADNAVIPGCTAVALTGGQATCSTTPSAGDHVVSAQYTGDDHYVASSATLTQTVNPASSGNTPPTLSLPPDQTAEATGPAGAVVSYTATATDAQDGTLTPTCNPASGSQFPLGVTQVSCSATDSLGLTTAGSFTVTVADTTPPSLTLPSDITAEADGPTGAAVSYTATATDLVDGSVPVICSPGSGSTFALDQTTTVNCSATDAQGNTATGSFTVAVVDTTPPSLTLPSDITAQATGPGGAAVSYTATATDLVNGSVPVNCTPPSGSTFPVGTTTVSCSATDAHGNTATSSFTVTVAYAWTGFFQPVDNPPTVNTLKAGSAIPVKFSLTGDQGLNIFQSGYPASATYTCNSGAPTDAIDQTVTAGNSGLSYDPSTDQYTYVWKTDKAWAGTCRALVVRLADGTTHTADFEFK
jgi:hypothetical protein